MTLREIDRDGVLPKKKIPEYPVDENNEYLKIKRNSYNQCLSDIESIGVEIDEEECYRIMVKVAADIWNRKGNPSAYTFVDEYAKAIASSPDIIKLVRLTAEGKK